MFYFSNVLMSKIVLFQLVFTWANTSLFLLLFVLFKQHYFYRKNCTIQRDLYSDRQGIAR